MPSNNNFINRRSALKTGLAGSAALLFPHGSAFSQAKKLGAASVGTGGIDAIYMAAYLADKLGYYKEEGFDAFEVVNAQSGVRARQIMIAGQVMFGMGGAADPVGATVAGKTAVLIFGADTAIAFNNLIVNKAEFDAGKVRKISDLAGRQIGVTQPQAAFWTMAKFMVEKAGMNDKIEIVPMGDIPTLLAGVKSGKVGGIIGTVPMVEAAVKEGFGVPLRHPDDMKAWADVVSSEIPGVGAYTLATTIQSKPEVVQGFVSALVKAQNYINTHSAKDIMDVVHKEVFSSFDRAALEPVIALYKEKVFAKDNMISKAGYERLLGFVGNGRNFTNEELKKAPFEDSVDMSFVKRARGLT